jgi:putative hydrolase of the HAD superfamily
MIKAVVFDYGGTLVRSEKPWDVVMPRAFLSAYRYLKRNGLKISYGEYLTASEDVFDRFAEQEAAEQRDIPDRLKYIDVVSHLFPGIAKTKCLELATGANNSFWLVANSNFELRENTRECLDELESMGIKLGMISNHHNGSALMQSLRRYRITARFNPIVISEKVKVRKPNPAIFRLCLSAMKARPSQAVYVGDAPEFDIAGAKATGMYSILIGNKGRGGPRPDFAVKGMDEIPQIVANLNGGEKNQGSAAAPSRPRHPKSSRS